MRCCSIFFRFVTGVPFPKSLTVSTAVRDREEEMSLLLKYLNQPDDINKVFPIEMFTPGSHTHILIKRWCTHIHCDAVTPRICNPEIRQLIQLPKQYTILLKRASDFLCPALGDVSRNPTLCLLCDTMLCSECYSCQKQGELGPTGACAVHATGCGGEVGMFLRIRDCDICLLYRSSKGMLWPSVYLDEYGEYDRHLYRGNPLYLNEQRYANLRLLWLNQKIPEVITQGMNQSPLSPTAPVIINWNEL